MKKEKIILIQRIFGIFLLIIGIILLFFSLYQIIDLPSFNVIDIPGEYNESGDYVNYIDQQVNSGQISREIGAMQYVALSQYTYEVYYFKTSLYTQIMIGSIILIIFGIMILLTAAFNNAKK